MSNEPFEYPETLNDCIQLTKTEAAIGTSLLQRRLRIGFTRAVACIKEMERLGYLEASEGSVCERRKVIKSAPAMTPTPDPAPEVKLCPECHKEMRPIRRVTGAPIAYWICADCGKAEWPPEDEEKAPAPSDWMREADKQQLQQDCARIASENACRMVNERKLEAEVARLTAELDKERARCMESIRREAESDAKHAKSIGETCHRQAKELREKDVENERLRKAVAEMLASAHPHPEENPAMYKAWQTGRNALEGKE